MADPTPSEIENSILRSTKQLLMIADDEDVYDVTIKTHINSAFATLFQAGVGPVEGFQINGLEDSWSQFIGNKIEINDVRSYIYLRVLMLFDRPTSSFGLTAVKEQIEELIWRLNVADDFTIVPISTPITP